MKKSEHEERMRKLQEKWDREKEDNEKNKAIVEKIIENEEYDCCNNEKFQEFYDNNFNTALGRTVYYYATYSAKLLQIIYRNNINITMFEEKYSDIKKYIANHKDATLKEYLDYLNQKDKDETDFFRKRIEMHQQWIRDNLAGKYALFRMNQGYHLVKFGVPNRYGDVKAYNVVFFDSDDESTHINRRKYPFMMDWIDSGYNDSKCEKRDIYVISDEKANEILSKLEESENYIKLLQGFENSDFAKKIEKDDKEHNV